MIIKYNGQKKHSEAHHRIGGINIKLWPDDTFFLDTTGKGPKRRLTIAELSKILDKMRKFAVKEQGLRWDRKP